MWFLHFSCFTVSVAIAQRQSFPQTFNFGAMNRMTAFRQPNSKPRIPSSSFDISNLVGVPAFRGPVPSFGQEPSRFNTRPKVNVELLFLPMSPWQNSCQDLGEVEKLIYWVFVSAFARVGYYKGLSACTHMPQREDNSQRVLSFIQCRH